MLYFGKTELRLWPKIDVVGARKEPVMYKACNLFEVGDDSLGKALVVTDLVEEVVTADDDNFSTWIPRLGQQKAFERAMVLCQTHRRGPDERFRHIAGTRAYTSSSVPPCRYRRGSPRTGFFEVEESGAS